MGKQSRVWVVDFDSDAVIDFEDVKSRGDRKAVFNVEYEAKPASFCPKAKSPVASGLKT